MIPIMKLIIPMELFNFLCTKTPWVTFSHLFFSLLSCNSLCYVSLVVAISWFNSRLDSLQRKRCYIGDTSHHFQDCSLPTSRWIDGAQSGNSCLFLYGMKGLLMKTLDEQTISVDPLTLQAVAGFMCQVLEKPIFFNTSRMVLTAGASSAIEILSFCLADNGNAFLVPTPLSPG